jgi:hypothetical protein
LINASRAASRPPQHEGKLIEAAVAIERQRADEIQLTDEDWKIIDARIEAARRGEIATDEEVAAVLGKYRSA